jgi:hypothetical protein
MHIPLPEGTMHAAINLTNLGRNPQEMLLELVSATVRKRTNCERSMRYAVIAELQQALGEDE